MVDAVSVTNWQPKWTIEHFSVLDSTNSALLEAGVEGASPGLVYVAAHQTAGRGRLDRKWSDEPGEALMFSVLLPSSVAVIGIATRAVALAGLDVCRGLGVDAEIKWPNDLMVNDAKLAGILGESRSTGGRISAAVVGCGLNVGSSPELSHDRRITSLNDHWSDSKTIDQLLNEMLNRLAVRFASDSVAKDFGAECRTVGRRVSIETNDGAIEGVAIDVDIHGNLIVKTSDGLVSVSAASALRTRVITESQM